MNNLLTNHPKAHAWLTEFHEEHLEEASFLCEQRLSSLDDLELIWQDLRDGEKRLEAHLAALVVGEDLALENCRQHAQEGDAGELNAALRVFCRHDRLELVKDVLAQLGDDDQERGQAVSDALCHELPDTWSSTVIDMLRSDNSTLTRIAARIIGYRRIDASSDLLHLLPECHPDALPILIWALGRLRVSEARASLYPFLDHDDTSTRAAAALALLRMGEQQVVQHCLALAPSQPWALFLVGLGGSRSNVSIPFTIASGDTPTTESLLALGLLGESAAIEVLLAHLAHEALAGAAATALHLITGAELYEEVFIPEEIDEDELFEEELAQLLRGESLTPDDEQPPGVTLSRLSQKRDDWQAWLNEHQARFQPGVRYRIGKPYSPACLLENLMSEQLSHQVRKWAYEELVIRYGLDVRFETDMFVARQQQALQQCAVWIETYSHTFQEGKWYFAGTLTAP
jgi:uncharacterized protein (TIGR02270 family)